MNAGRELKSYRENQMEFTDDDITKFAAEGAAPLADTAEQGSIDHDGARIWYAAFGAGPAVFLLHGGLGHSGNWGFQVPHLSIMDTARL